MKDALKKKGMFVKKLSNQGEFFRKRWEHEFASVLSASQKKTIYMDEFLWYAFSYEKLMWTLLLPNIIMIEPAVFINTAGFFVIKKHFIN
ncbi:Uncharacterised protein [Streptococcus pneumoniae]|nr:Uncharacterised protein [Streptococcus pneumoniae]